MIILKNSANRGSLHSFRPPRCFRDSALPAGGKRRPASHFIVRL